MIKKWFKNLCSWFYLTFHSCEENAERYTTHDVFSTKFRKHCKICGRDWIYDSLR